MAFGMATFWYGQHYREKMSPQFTKDQKLDIANRISQLTLRSAIWLDRNKDYRDQFPELDPYVSKSVPLSGLYLCAIMEEIVKEIKQR